MCLGVLRDLVLDDVGHIFPDKTGGFLTSFQLFISMTRFRVVLVVVIHTNASSKGYNIYTISNDRRWQLSVRCDLYKQASAAPQKHLYFSACCTNLDTVISYSLLVLVKSHKLVSALNMILRGIDRLARAGCNITMQCYVSTWPYSWKVNLLASFSSDKGLIRWSCCCGCGWCWWRWPNASLIITLLLKFMNLYSSVQLFPCLC